MTISLLTVRITLVHSSLNIRGGSSDTNMHLQCHFPDRESRESYNITTLCTFSNLSGAQYLVFAWAHPFWSCQSW